MIGDRWRRLEEIYHSARELGGEKRAAYLAQACAADDDLRLHIESLLAHGELLSQLETAAAPSSSLPDGTLVGPYRIDKRLDAGGMGVVYRATDTRLGRTVAVKIGFAQFSDRFHREARAIAALNHPHVCTLHDIGSTGEVPSFLVMEFVDGDTLEDALRSGRLPIARVVEIARMIASALAAAHERGIVHRDLKPANIKITPQGSVKVLDFGLAKGFPASSSEEAIGGLTAGALTMAGTVLGTAAYMSPEQAARKDADARSDIFSFGSVLYEMVSGQRPFTGRTSADIVASVLRDDPPALRSLRSGIPTALVHVAEKCLRKSPDERYASAVDLLKDLNALVRPAQASRKSLMRAALVTAATLLSAAGAYNAWQSYRRQADLRWLEQTAVPEITKLLTGHRNLAARKLYLEAERVAPESKLLYPLSDGVALRPDTVFETTPPGAKVYVSDYTAGAGDDLSAWHFVGETPAKSSELPRWGYYRVRFIKDGFAPVDRAFEGTPGAVTLQTADSTPAGMVWVPATNASRVRPQIPVPGFWIDRYEVTNRQFKEFLDDGGYEKPVYWTQTFVKDQRPISREQAMLEFRDLSGRVGPAGWSLGTYPEGTGDHPVAGVSWYEAAAYAVYAGKALPTAYEWREAAPIHNNTDILTLSNFSARQTSQIAKSRGMAASGAYDMAGNVTEWTINPDGHQKVIMGGGWDEPAYMFLASDTRDPFMRTNALGFRTVRRVTAPSPASLAHVSRNVRVAPAEKPVGDATYQEYALLHRYPEGEGLEARKEGPDRSSPIWTRETWSFNAAYGNQRMLAHVFLPRNAVPPYQVVIVLGGAGINAIKRVDDFQYPYEFLVRAGRAVVIPAYWGTLERGPSELRLQDNDEVDRARKWYWDLARTVDYLETRPDIDATKLGFYALSWGAFHAPRLLALEKRFQASVLVSGGLSTQPRSVDSWNFAPRSTVPTLMLSGKYDAAFPYETNLRPLFDALGTARADKDLQLFDGGHANPVTRPETLGNIVTWFDRYLGRVRERETPGAVE